jgi:urea carboxylase
MFKRVLIANRGAIAVRIMRTLRRMGIGAVAVYSDADRYAPHVRMADAAIHLGPAPAAASYLQPARIIAAAHSAGATGIHPGYGFLSENADFAAACEAAGIAFIGPTPQQMRDFGLKHTARALAIANGVRLLPGTELLTDRAAAASEAVRIGYPVMLKSTAGGGGIGMQHCRNERELLAAFESVRRLAHNNFSQSGVFLERFVPNARHIEVQIFGDGRGQVVALGERDCSAQRRNQKVLEETPAPNLEPEMRRSLAKTAVSLGQAVRYRSAGTVEFVYDIARRAAYFLEVNTRLQVEHGVTEAVSGVDLVEWMVRVAAGDPPDLQHFTYRPSGHAIQARLYAEDPARGFRPSVGLLTEVRLPQSLRADAWVETGTEVTAHYDPLLAKLIAHGATREAARAQLDAALRDTVIHGVETNADYLRAVLNTSEFRNGSFTTRGLADFVWTSASVEVLQPGTQTLIQDWPGRLGHWEVGVPPSGPMDALSFRLANRLLGNDASAAGLELTVTGPTLRFAVPAIIVLTGAKLHATLDGQPLRWWRPVTVPAGGVLKLGAIEGRGLRSYLCVKGGFDIPEYLGSRATFTLGQFGGHGGRQLRSGDVLRLRSGANDHSGLRELVDSLWPELSQRWELAVLEGPHAAPEFFTPQDMASFYATDWEVHYNSSRTGVRLIGPKPQWARADGGEAGLHPSNIHDNAYAVGSIDFTGDMPVILGPDGPSLGGFVCPATIVLADLWKVGQLCPGDKVRFTPVSLLKAEQLQQQQELLIETLAPLPTVARATSRCPPASAILYVAAATARCPAVVVRQSGEDNLLIEFGEPELDLALRFQVQALYAALQATAHPAVLDLTPGIRSLQVHFNNRRCCQRDMLQAVLGLLDMLPATDAMAMPSRIVHLPLSWDDPATRLAIERYSQAVRADAPWCPSNIEFIRRINGLESVDDVQRIVHAASYLVLGLGDVYLGAPVAKPLDPRHRLVTTKYNPARTWTPENAVGIGGAYLCIYGMEGPGGYQFVGRTLQMWNRHRVTAEFHQDRPWLLRCFDQLRFYPVSADELLELRAGFPHGQCGLRIEATSLQLAEYRQFLQANAPSIQQFREQQRSAFAAERARWRQAGHSEVIVAEPGPPETQADELPAGCVAVSAPVTGSVWQVDVATGTRVAAGDRLVALESMKMEISVLAEQGGTVVELRCAPGKAVHAGATLLVLRPNAV